MTADTAAVLRVGLIGGALVCLVCILCLFVYAWANEDRYKETGLSVLLACLGACLWGLVWLRLNGF